jgi:DnaJ-domain-containing protein 1
MKQDKLAFFKFYYYLAKGSPKKYAMLNLYNNNFLVTQMTPFFFFVSWMLFYLFYGGITGTMWPLIPFALSGAFMIVNLLITRFVHEEGRKIERELEEQRREVERMERQREFEERQRQHRERMRQLDEEMEEIRKRMERMQQERMRRARESFERQYREQQQQRYRQQQQQQRTQSSTTDRLRDAYRILGIEPTRDSEVIRKAYRKMAKQNHPDVGGTQEKFIAVKDAYDLLMKAIQVTTRRV